MTIWTSSDDQQLNKTYVVTCSLKDAKGWRPFYANRCFTYTETGIMRFYNPFKQNKMTIWTSSDNQRVNKTYVVSCFWKVQKG
jgi:hypothetical protein